MTTHGLAYSEICRDERALTAAAFWTRASAFFAARGFVIQRVLTDNAFIYRRSFAFRTAVLGERRDAALHAGVASPNQRRGYTCALPGGLTLRPTE